MELIGARRAPAGFGGRTSSVQRSCTLPAAGEGLSQATGVVGNLRVLVVEDDYFIGLTIEAALLDAGYEVIGVVASGEEAIEIASDECPQLALLDLRLAGQMNGVEAAKHMSALGITSLFVTANDDPSFRVPNDRLGSRGWLPKPFTTRDLLAAVTTALGGAELP